ncbi:thermonuclease family protein [Hellea sp.]|nr:thermonuclease family protein [Hellea sp.]
MKINKSRIFALAVLSLAISSCSAVAGETTSKPEIENRVFTSIYWSDADSGRLGELKFRIANKDAPETGSLKQRGGAKCEAERALGYEAKAYMVGYTRGKLIRIERDYGEDRYGRLVVDLSADGDDVGEAGEEAGHLRDWPHKNGRALAPKPDWCAP